MCLFFPLISLWMYRVCIVYLTYIYRISIVIYSEKMDDNDAKNRLKLFIEWCLKLVILGVIFCAVCVWFWRGFEYVFWGC